MKIGILSKNYAAKRLFLNKIEGACYKDIRFKNWYLWRNAHLWFLRTIGKLKMSPEEQVAKLFYEYRSMVPTGCDLFHFFNTINYSIKTSWVVSVESGVPWPIQVTRCVESIDGDLAVLKNDKYVGRALYYLAQPNCRGLLALSDCTKRIQMEIIKMYPQYEQTIKDKLITLHPSQELMIEKVEDKGLKYTDDEQFTFFYVGKNFYRKGGVETLEVLTDLHKKYAFKLVVISALEEDEVRYMYHGRNEEYCMRIINSNKDWIEFYRGLPNEQVLEIAKKSHVALLPTWMDTYGYSILEMMACGTPTISTSLRALTEINTDEVGWLIEVPVNRLNNPIHNTAEQQEIFYEKLKKGLKERVEYVLNNRDVVKKKAESCLEKIKKDHSPTEYNRKLNMVYEGRVNELL